MHTHWGQNTSGNPNSWYLKCHKNSLAILNVVMLSRNLIQRTHDKELFFNWWLNKCYLHRGEIKLIYYAIFCHFIDINNLLSGVIIKWSNLLPSNQLHMRLCTFDIYTTSPVYQTPCALWLYHQALGLAFYWDAKLEFILLFCLVYLTLEMTNWIMIFHKKDSDYRKKQVTCLYYKPFPF